MDRNDIRQMLESNLGEITDADGLVLTDATTPDQVAGWDSVNHVKLLFAVEEELGVSFQVEEMVLPATVGKLLDVIQAHQAAA